MSGVMDRVRLAAARAAAGPLGDVRVRPSFPRVAAQSPFPPDAGPAQFVVRFRAELEALAGKVYGPLDAEGVARQVVELVRAATGEDSGLRAEDSALSAREASRSSALGPQSSQSRLLSWDDAELGCPGLGDALRRAGIELVPGAVPNDADHQRVLERLASLQVGLSGAVGGLADTGSIVVASGPGRSRVASLLPPVHVAVLPVSRIYPTMQEWLAGGGTRLVAGCANVVVITGSSRTSDIELQLTLGMHGPKELHVVLYEG